MDIVYSWATLTITFVAVMLCLSLLGRRPKKNNMNGTVGELASPPKLPVLGHLHLLNGDPFVQMTLLAKKYGEIYSLQLGTVNTIVVNSINLIKQILVEKGSDFGDRPNFLRYHILFGNDKENSLAFCNWSQVQKTRRALARRFCHTGIFAERINNSVETAAQRLITSITESENNPNSHIALKLHLQKACASVFFDFFCGEQFEDEDTEFEVVVQLFDEIFWEINQSHPTDVLPFLAPFYRSHLDNLANMGKHIRAFVVERIIKRHLERLDKDNVEDFVDILLIHLEDAEPSNRLTLNQVLYELEDFIGGHSAVSNLLFRALIEIASVEGLSQKIYQKYFVEGNADYILAVIYETLRKTSSPIVPHVASNDSVIAGCTIKKGTMVIFNTYELNTSEQYWSMPHLFQPERFLTSNGTFRKPADFLPFSTGKRTCMGYKLVEKVTSGFIVTILRHFDIVAMENPNILAPNCVALHPNVDLRVKLIPRINDVI